MIIAVLKVDRRQNLNIVILFTYTIQDSGFIIQLISD